MTQKQIYNKIVERQNKEVNIKNYKSQQEDTERITASAMLCDMGVWFNLEEEKKN